MDAQTSNVVYELADCAAVVRLNRPDKLNAFTVQMIGEIRAAVERAAADERATGIIITGNGRGFSAGLDAADLARSAASGESGASTSPHELPALFSFLLRIPKPVIAAVNGVAAGGGFVLAMMCDLRFASAEASFTTVFSKRGLIAEHLTSWLLPRMVGTSRALDLLWSSRRVDSAEALRIGLVDRVVPPERLLEEARGYIAELAASVSPRSLAVMKAQIYRHWSQGLEAASRDTDTLVSQALKHPDATEGVKSFVERRPPRFARFKGEGS
jgi:enoyl-CoA hydratase/carnithine racemase